MAILCAEARFTNCSCPSCEVENIMSIDNVTVLCTNCGLVSRRPGNFVRVRRMFVCGGCKEIIPLDSRTILDSEKRLLELAEERE